MQPDEAQMLKLIEAAAQGDRNLAEEMQEDFLHLGVAILAAFTYVPLNVSIKTQAQKHKVSKYLSAKLLEPVNLKFTENWLVFLRHPTSCINVLKGLYSMCMVNANICLFVSKRTILMEALLDILAEKVQKSNLNRIINNKSRRNAHFQLKIGRLYIFKRFTV